MNALQTLLKQLKLFFFNFNEQFKFLDKDEFIDVKRLTKIRLDGNQLSVVVDPLFRMQKSLQHLGISIFSLANSVQIAKGPSICQRFALNFIQQQRPQKNNFFCSFFAIDLSYNRLAKVPNDSFQHLTNLSYLDLSYNKLVRLEPQSVRNLKNLRTLNISGNILMDLMEIRFTFEVSGSSN